MTSASHCALMLLFGLRLSGVARRFSSALRLASLNEFSEEENLIRETGKQASKQAEGAFGRPDAVFTHFLFLCVCVCVSRIVRKFAQEVIRPKVAEMDEKEQMCPAIIKALFENGVSACVQCAMQQRLTGANSFSVETDCS